MSSTSKTACTPLDLIWQDICTLGCREGVEAAAEAQSPLFLQQQPEDHKKRNVDNNILEISIDEDNSITERLLGATYSAEKKDAAAGRALDHVVDVAGSRVFFGSVLGAITGWAIAGGLTGAPDIWQIIFQDISSIQCYISDMILMRQQQNDFREHLRIIALLRSRSYTITKCFHLLIKQEQYSRSSSSLRNLHNLDVTGLANEELAQLSSSSSSSGAAGATTTPTAPTAPTPTTASIQIEIGSSLKSCHHHLIHDIEKDAKQLDEVGHATTLVPENLIDRSIVYITDVMGSIWMLFVFIFGIAAWIGLGTLYNFSNHWQLWLNTATALQQTLSSCLLTLARKRHTYFVERCVCEIFKKDCEVEYRARRLTGYDVPNKAVKIEWSVEHLFERVLDWYAAFVGSGYSASGSLLLVVVWLSTGHLMNWGDNWWLIIGTWSGVVGTFNAAVLRYSLFRQDVKAEKEYNTMIEQDKVTFNALGLKCACDQRENAENELSCMTRLSLFTSWICATPWAVLGTLTLIIGLLIGATVVLWCEAAQLMVNSVTMILESFFLIVLIEAHIIQAAKHRVHLHDLLVRRLQLLVILRRIEMDRVDAIMDGSSMKSVAEEEIDSLKLEEEEEEESL